MNTIITQLNPWYLVTALTNVSLGNNKITDVALATEQQDAVSLECLQQNMTQWSAYSAISDIGANGYKLVGLGYPTNAQDATTKEYVDTIIQPPNFAANGLDLRYAKIINIHLTYAHSTPIAQNNSALVNMVFNANASAYIQNWLS